MASKKLVVIKEKNDTSIRKSLLQTITRKQKALLTLTEKVELLRMDLDIIKQEYHVRIGRLYLKDDQLDLEIIRYKNIKSLLEQGLTYEEAVKKINDQYYSEKKEFTFREEELKESEMLFTKRKHITERAQEDIKKLWKKLLFQLHPDLTPNNDEKKRREKVIRKINEAYEENNFEELRNIENQYTIGYSTEETIDDLEQRIIDLENSIITYQNEYKLLRGSEWYVWRKKSLRAQKKNIDIFKELEDKLLEDIVKKIEIVNVFRKGFDKKGYY